ncbi:hypothetical protein XELAEV_18037231mg [Xenopus laevis]|uniref:Helix-turn-helix domain-containing protein n=1 Tax=Xenopus laevis TaxID=8355 RepID=A0A974H9Y7_XENLA|nr:hypothetical protein XELAEV_18037231mg [Xenopus laevis]
MGSTCAPTYANLYLGWWERKWVFGDNMAEYTQHIPLWARYIDDIVLIWTSTASKFESFVNLLNTNDINLKVTSIIDKNTINFLDIRIFCDPTNDNLSTTVYPKETATNSLLHAKSQHPKNIILGIPVGQYLRVKRLCSSANEFKIEAKKLYWRFKERGYSHNSLKKAYNRALCTERKLFLTVKNKSSPYQVKPVENTIRLIGDYSKQHNEITDILNKHWHILQQDTDLSKVLGLRPHVTYRRSRNLRDQLTQSHYVQSNNDTTMIFRKTDNIHHNLAHFINCKTQSVIYVMKCACGIEYVGKTIREFRQRIMEHVGDVRHKRNTSIANHINICHNGNTNMMHFIGVEKVLSTTHIGDLDRKLLQKEAE